MRTGLSGIFILLTVFLTTACHNTHADESYRGIPDTLNVAVELSALTLSPAGDTISGFSFEVLNALCHRKNLNFKYEVYNNIEDAFNDNEKENFHLFLSNLPITTSLKDDFLITEPLFTDRQVLVQNKETAGDSLITTQQELSGRTIWIPKKSAISERLKNLMDEIGSTIVVVEIDDISEEQLVILISLGEIHRGVVSESVARQLFTVYPHIDIETRLSFPQFKSWFLNPCDSILRDSLNLWLTDFKATNEFQTLAKKYKVDINTNGKRN